MTRIWHKGPPPAPGWYPASRWRDANAIRWFNGECWSWAVNVTCSREDAAKMAAVREKVYSENEPEIEWTDPWW